MKLLPKFSRNIPRRFLLTSFLLGDAFLCKVSSFFKLSVKFTGIVWGFFGYFSLFRFVFVCSNSLGFERSFILSISRLPLRLFGDVQRAAVTRIS